MARISEVVIYTDGACSGNPGPGGWGAVLKCVAEQKEISGGDPQSTNNRMEMTAAIKALRILKYPCKVTLYSDSQLLVNGMTQWIEGWKANGWKTSKGKPVLNVDLWQELEEAASHHEVTFQWIRGHAGNLYNEQADRLASSAIPNL